MLHRAYASINCPLTLQFSKRFAKFPSGFAGTAAIRTNTGQILTSVCFDSPNSVASLCHEMGAFCEADRLGVSIVASVCESRREPDRPFFILAACGICQERLALWGRTQRLALRSPISQATNSRSGSSSSNHTTGVMALSMLAKVKIRDALVLSAGACRRVQTRSSELFSAAAIVAAEIALVRRLPVMTGPTK